MEIIQSQRALQRFSSWSSSGHFHFNFGYSIIHHCICREYFDHCCSSESFVALSVVETFARLFGEHRSGRGPHTHPLRGGIHLSRDHSKDWYYFWFLFIITSLLFSGVSLLTMTAIRVDRLLAPFLGLRYRQVVTVRRVMALVDTLWVSSCYLPYGVISSFMIITGLETRPLYFTWSLKISLMLFNSTLNLFLYCWRMREMIQRVKDIIRRFSCPSQKAT